MNHGFGIAYIYVSRFCLETKQDLFKAHKILFFLPDLTEAQVPNNLTLAD